MELLELWEKRRVQFEQCMELQLFNRDCEHADATMTKQEVRTCINAHMCRPLSLFVSLFLETCLLFSVELSGSRNSSITILHSILTFYYCTFRNLA